MLENSYKRISGFALLEVMIATIILCGLIYTFISFSQVQQKQANNQVVGKHISMAVNQLLTGIATNTSECTGDGISNFAQCTNMSPAFQDVLTKDGIDLTQSTVQNISD